MFSFKFHTGETGTLMLEMKSASQWRQYPDAGMSQSCASNWDSIERSQEKISQYDHNIYNEKSHVS